MTDLDNKIKPLRRVVSYNSALAAAKEAERKEQSFQSEMSRSGVPEWGAVHAYKNIVFLLETLGEDTYTDLMNYPLNNGLNTPGARRMAAKALAAAVKRCQDLGMDTELEKQENDN